MKDNINNIFVSIKKRFPDIDAKLVEINMSSFMVSDPCSRKIYYDPKQLRKFNFSKKALIGIIAHEFSHKVDYKRMNWIERLFLIRRHKRDFNFKRRLEREADAIAVSRGFGEELKQAFKESKIKFEKERFLRLKDVRLNIKEIDKIMLNLKH